MFTDRNHILLKLLVLAVLGLFAFGPKLASQAKPQRPCNESHEARLQPGCDDLGYDNLPSAGAWN